MPTTSERFRILNLIIFIGVLILYPLYNQPSSRRVLFWHAHDYLTAVSEVDKPNELLATQEVSTDTQPSQDPITAQTLEALEITQTLQPRNMLQVANFSWKNSLFETATDVLFVNPTCLYRKWIYVIGDSSGRFLFYHLAYVVYKIYGVY